MAFENQIGSLQPGSMDNEGKQYVTILAYALLCKGYHPGAVDGSFQESTAKGILEMKRDAGFADAQDPQVNAMWMKAALSSDSYLPANSGDAVIRAIQQYLDRG